MKEDNFKRLQEKYKEIEQLRNFFSGGLIRISWIKSLYDDYTNLLGYNDRTISISESLSDEIIELMRKRLATLEEQFKQM